MNNIKKFDIKTRNFIELIATTTTRIITECFVVVSDFKIEFKSYQSTLSVKVLIKNPVSEHIFYALQYSTTIMLNVNFYFEIKNNILYCKEMNCYTLLYNQEKRKTVKEKVMQDFPAITLDTPKEEIVETINQTIQKYKELLYKLEGTTSYSNIMGEFYDPNIETLQKIYNNNFSMLIITAKQVFKFYQELMKEIEPFIDKTKMTPPIYNNISEFIKSINQLQPIPLKNNYTIYYILTIENNNYPLKLRFSISCLYKTTKPINNLRVNYSYHFVFTPIFEEQQERIYKKMIDKLKYYIEYGTKKTSSENNK